MVLVLPRELITEGRSPETVASTQALPVDASSASGPGRLST